MDFLKDILGDELFGQVEAKLKGNDKVKLANLADGEYVGIAKFETAQEAAKKLQETLDGRENDLKELKKNVGDNDELKTSFDTLQTEYDNAKEQAVKDLLTADIKLGIVEFGGRSTTSILGHIDEAKVTRVNGNLAGLSEQLTPLKEKHDYLFGDPKKIYKSDPANPPLNDDGDTESEWTEKLSKATTTRERIAVKQAAHKEGVVV